MPAQAIASRGSINRTEQDTYWRKMMNLLADRQNFNQNYLSSTEVVKIYCGLWSCTKNTIQHEAIILFYRMNG